MVAVRGFRDAGVNEFGAVPIAATESEQPIRVGLLLEALEGLDEPAVVLAGMLEAGDIQKEWFVELEFFANGSAGLVAVVRQETFVIDAVVDDAQLLLGNPKELLDIRGCVLADGDDLVLPASEEFHDDATVERAGEVVFVHNAEWRQIVDCCDEGAGTAPDKAAIARDVKQIESKAPRKRRKNGVVPDDIANGRAIFFRNETKFETFSQVVKKTGVVFQDEEDEFFGCGLRSEGAQQ